MLAAGVLAAKRTPGGGQARGAGGQWRAPEIIAACANSAAWYVLCSMGNAGSQTFQVSILVLNSLHHGHCLSGCACLDLLSAARWFNLGACHVYDVPLLHVHQDARHYSPGVRTQEARSTSITSGKARAVLAPERSCGGSCAFIPEHAP
eukprot:jgi/Ulvmu1/8182/UM040_0079.1